MSITRHDHFNSQNEWIKQSCQFIASKLNSHLILNDRASLILPGGSTAKKILPTLCFENIDWSRIDVSVTDERWVEEDSLASNMGQVKRLLEVDGANFVSLKCSMEQGGDAQKILTRRIETMVQPFSVVFLGMGEDGHVASLFPNDQDVLNSSNAIQFVLRPDFQRVSLGRTILETAQEILISTEGSAKLKQLEDAKREANFLKSPVSYFLHSKRAKVTLCTCD